MAKIAFFTESLPPAGDPIAAFAYDLATALADQQHEIRVFSTYRDGDSLPPTHSRLEILRPFKRWNWLELPRLIPILLGFQPDILHFIQPRYEALEGFTNAMTALPSLAPLLGRAGVVSSFYDLRPQLLKEHRPLLFASDAITVTNLPQRELIERFTKEFSARTPLITLLPVPAARPQLEISSLHAAETDDTSAFLHHDTHDKEALAAFLEANAKVVLIPGNLDQHKDPYLLLSLLADSLRSHPDAALLFGGDWGRVSTRERHRWMELFSDPNLGRRFFISGPLSTETESWLLEKVHVVFVPSLPNESIQLTRLLREALIASAPIIMSRTQATLDSLPWQDRETALLTGTNPEEWTSVLNEALSADALARSVRERLPDFARSEALDQPGNVMSRLYNEVLARKRR